MRAEIKKCYISKNYNNPFTASSKAKLDAETVLKNNGYKNLGLPPTTIDNFWGSILTFISNLTGVIKMPFNQLMVFQLPQHNLGWKFRIARKKKNRIVLIIHDLNSIRYKNDKDLKFFHEADFLVCHNEAMKKWLVERGVKSPDKIFNLGIFDYLADDEIKSYSSPRFDKQRIKVAFAGNLTKSNFLNYCQFDKITLNLFGIKNSDFKTAPGMKYVGCFAPDKLYRYLDSHFGLCWDGDSAEGCKGIIGEYISYISPHKVSMYLSAGLPVIIWEKAGVADFIKENKLGILIGSLNDLEHRLLELSVEEYEEMKRNVESVRDKILKGGFLTSTLHKIENKIATGYESD